jgi:hypothetical protein
MYDEREMVPPEHPRSTNPWPEHVAVTTPEEIRYAEQLRLRIRESYLGRGVSPPSISAISVD